MSLAYTITPGGVSLVLDNRMRSVPRSSVNFSAVVDAIRSGAALDVLRTLVDIPSFIAKATFGRVQVGTGEVRFDGKKVGGAIADRLLQFLDQGLDLAPLALFMDRLMENPLGSAREELYLFLESGNNPITSDGCFLAFKKVRANYLDIHSGSIDNSVGKVPEMNREDVDADRSTLCSSGLHFCSWTYLSQFGHGSAGSRVVIVKIDPADVVAIPADYSNAKGRTWRYEVVGEVPEEECKHLFEGRPVYDYASNVVGVDEDGDPLTDGSDFGVEPEEEEEWAELDDALDAIDTALGACTAVVGPLSFSHAGRTFTANEVETLIKDHGQRGTSRLTGVPRTTLQDWVRAIG